MHTITKILAASTICALASFSQAYEGGDIIARAGLASVQPNDSSSQLRLAAGNGPATPIAGSGALVEDDQQLGLTFVYMLNPNVGVELLASTPFNHDIKADTGALDLGVVPAGSTKHLPPTLSLQYYFRGMQEGWQPYAGVGVNYTYFFDEDVSSTIESALNGGQKATLDLSNSLGLAAQVGADFPLGENLVLNAAVWYIDIETDATIRLDGARVKTSVSIDPWVYMLGLGMKF